MSHRTPIDALASLAPQQPWLFGRLMSFSYRPADYVHRSRRPAGTRPGCDALWSQPRARGALSMLLLKALSLQDRPCADPSCPELPQALLDAARLQHLALAVGAVVLAPRIRRGIARADVLRWKEQLTPELYAFAMHSAPLLPLQGLLPGDLPEAAALEIGEEWLAASFDGAVEEVRERALLKLPAGVKRGAVDPIRARQVVQRIHSTLEPRWCSLFATRA